MDDQAFDQFRPSFNYPESDRATIILHIKTNMLQLQGINELLDDLCEMVKGVVKCRRVGATAIAKTGIVGRDQMIFQRAARSGFGTCGTTTETREAIR